MELYEKLKDITPKTFMEYFDDKWHKIRKE